MGANSYDHREAPGRLSDFLAETSEPLASTLARIEGKLDVLTGALVQPQSSIILVGEDIARIAAELKRSKG